MFLNKTIDDHDVPIHHNGIDSEHKDFQCKAGLINTSREMYVQHCRSERIGCWAIVQCIIPTVCCSSILIHSLQIVVVASHSHGFYYLFPNIKLVSVAVATLGSMISVLLWPITSMHMDAWFV